MEILDRAAEIGPYNLLYLVRQVIYEFSMPGQPLRMLDRNDLHAQLDAFAADEAVRAGNQLQDVRLGLSAERT